MPQKIFTASPDGTVTYLNRQWTDFTGASPEQIRDRGWMQFLHPDDLEENTRAWRKMLETGEPFQSIHRLRRADARVSLAPEPRRSDARREWENPYVDRLRH